jgi:hypothetical protein
MSTKSCEKTSTFRWTAGRTSQMGPKIIWQTIQISLQEGWKDVTEHFEEGGRHVICDKLSTSKPEWMKNTWMGYTGVRMSQGQICHIRRFVGGRIVWVKFWRGRFVGGLIVKAPQSPVLSIQKLCKASAWRGLDYSPSFKHSKGGVDYPVC